MENIFLELIVWYEIRTRIKWNTGKWTASKSHLNEREIKEKDVTNLTMQKTVCYCCCFSCCVVKHIQAIQRNDIKKTYTDKVMVPTDKMHKKHFLLYWLNKKNVLIKRTYEMLCTIFFPCSLLYLSLSLLLVLSLSMNLYMEFLP